MALTCSSSRPCTVRVWLMVLSRGSTVLACSCTAASICASSSSATVRRPAKAPTAGGMLHRKERLKALADSWGDYSVSAPVSRHPMHCCAGPQLRGH